MEEEEKRMLRSLFSLTNMDRITYRYRKLIFKHDVVDMG